MPATCWFGLAGVSASVRSGAAGAELETLIAFGDVYVAALPTLSETV